MKRPLFLALVILGIIGFYVMAALEVKHYFVYTFLYLGVVFEIRRWYLTRFNKWSFWHFWDPRNFLDQFKKP